MPCFDMSDPKTGLRAIVCTGRQRRKRCFVVDCGRWADFLCDGKLSNGKTCDRPICKDRHRHNAAPEVDYCLECKLANQKGRTRA